MRNLFRLGIPAAVAALLVQPADVAAQDWTTAIAGPDASTSRSWEAPTGLPDGLTPVGFSLSSFDGLGMSGMNLNTRSGNSSAFQLMTGPRLFVQQSPDDSCSNGCTRVPEPANGALLMLGLLAVGIVGVRRAGSEEAPLRI